MAEIVDRLFVRSDETADGSKRLTECTHNQVYIVCYSEMITGSTTVIAQNTQTVGLVYHYACVILFG